MRIEWSDSAYDDLTEILNYFKGIDNEDLGHEIVNELFISTDPLTDFPLLGRIGRIADTRELVNQLFPYITIYRVVSEDTIRILGVIHTSRLFPEAL
jgi:toxin ParE1/3/4